MVKTQAAEFLASVIPGARVLVIFAGKRGAGIPYSIGTAKLFLDHGCSVDLLASSAVLDPAFRLPERIGRHFVFDVNAAPPIKMLASAQQVHQAKSENAQPYDIAVVVMESPYSSLPLWLVGQHGLAERRVLTIHDAEPHPGDIVSHVGGAVHRLALAWATEIIAPSQFTANRLCRERRITKPISVQPINHVHAGALDQLIWPANGGGGSTAPKPDDVRFVMVGRLLPYKGTTMLEQLVQAMSEQSGWTLEVAGTGLSQVLAQQLEAMDHRVHLDRSWMEWEAYYRRLNKADCLLCTHTEASQSGLIADAIALNKRIVCTNVGGLPEQLEGYENAILAQPTPLALAVAMRQIIQAP